MATTRRWASNKPAPCIPATSAKPTRDHRIQISGEEPRHARQIELTDGSVRGCQPKCYQAQDDPLPRRAQTQALRAGMDHGQQKHNCCAAE